MGRKFAKATTTSSCFTTLNYESMLQNYMYIAQKHPQVQRKLKLVGETELHNEKDNEVESPWPNNDGNTPTQNLNINPNPDTNEGCQGSQFVRNNEIYQNVMGSSNCSLSSSASSIYNSPSCSQVDSQASSLTQAHSNVSLQSYHTNDSESLRNDLLHTKLRIAALKNELTKLAEVQRFQQTQTLALDFETRQSLNANSDVNNNHSASSTYAKLFNSDPTLPHNRILFASSRGNCNYYASNVTTASSHPFHLIPPGQDLSTDCSNHRILSHKLSHDSTVQMLPSAAATPSLSMYLPPLPLSHYYVDKNNTDSSLSSLSFVSTPNPNYYIPFNNLPNTEDSFPCTPSSTHPATYQPPDLRYPQTQNSSTSFLPSNNARQSSYPQTNFGSIFSNSENITSATNHRPQNLLGTLGTGGGGGIHKNLSETSLLQFAYENERRKLEKLRMHLSLLEDISHHDTHLGTDDRERILNIRDKDDLIKKYKRIIAQTLSKSPPEQFVVAPKGQHYPKLCLSPSPEIIPYRHQQNQQSQFMEDFDYTDDEEMVKEALNHHIDHHDHHPHPLSESDLQALNRNIERLELDLQNELRLSNQNISQRIKIHTEKNRLEKELQTSMEELAKLEEKIIQNSQENLNFAFPIYVPNLSQSLNEIRLDPNYLYEELVCKEKCLQSLYEKILLQQQERQQKQHQSPDSFMMIPSNPQKSSHSLKSFKRDDTLTENTTTQHTTIDSGISIRQEETCLFNYGLDNRHPPRFIIIEEPPPPPPMIISSQHSCTASSPTFVNTFTATTKSKTITECYAFV